MLDNLSTEIYPVIVVLKAGLLMSGIHLIFVILVLIINGNNMPLKLKFDGPSKKSFL